MVYGQPFWPFKGQRPQERPKTFLAWGSRAELAEVGCSGPLSPSPSAVRARSSARAQCCAVHSVHTVPFTCPPHCCAQQCPRTAEGERERGCCSQSTSAPVHHSEQEYSCLVYFLQLLLWLVHDPVTSTMAAWQPHFGAIVGLEPLGSDLEGC